MYALDFYYLVTSLLFLAVPWSVFIYFFESASLATIASGQGNKYPALAFVPFIRQFFYGKILDHVFYTAKKKKTNFSFLALGMSVIRVIISDVYVMAAPIAWILLRPWSTYALDNNWLINLLDIGKYQPREVIGFIAYLLLLIFQLFIIYQLEKEYCPKVAFRHLILGVIFFFIPLHPFYLLGLRKYMVPKRQTNYFANSNTNYRYQNVQSYPNNPQYSGYENNVNNPGYSGHSNANRYGSNVNNPGYSGYSNANGYGSNVNNPGYSGHSNANGYGSDMYYPEYSSNPNANGYAYPPYQNQNNGDTNNTDSGY